ncbi:MAG: hypothetical protein JXX14_13530 [Deltaproteobacteria bacterium]|nr:hypothetical protein [Deltaproteobacteria bacterium]
MQEQLVKNEQQMLALACQSAGLGSWRLSRDAKVITLSAPLCMLLKADADPDTAIDLPYDEFNNKYVHPEDRWFVREYQFEPPGHKYSFRVRCTDGTERWLEAFPVSNGTSLNGTVTGVVQDVTERVASEDDMRNARKMESIRSIAGGIAHEFNNILYSMSGYISLMKEMLGDATPLDTIELNEYIGEMEYSNRRAVRLIKKIQTFSHSGKQGISQVKLEEAVNKVLQNIPFPQTVTFKLAVNLSENDRVYVNAMILQESLANVISNGIAAMDSVGGGTLEMELDTVFEEGNRPVTCGSIRTGYYGRVTIKDEGCGMDRNTLNRIFEPFFTTKQAGQGTGLGLAIVYGMVNAAGGAVEVHSQPGNGTRFRIYLPACNVTTGEETIQ